MQPPPSHRTNPRTRLHPPTYLPPHASPDNTPLHLTNKTTTHTCVLPHPKFNITLVLPNMFLPRPNITPLPPI